MPLLHAIRPRSYFKNLLLFVGVFHAPGAHETPAFLRSSATACVAFCLLSSCVYLFNDVFDLETDRRHPDKRLRPLAQGLLSVRRSLLTAALLAASGACLLAIQAPGAGPAAAAFLGINLFYSAGLNRIPWLEMALVAASYALRAEAGLLLVPNAAISWALPAAFAAGLTGVACKRRAELLRPDAVSSRPVLGRYGATGLRRLILASCVLCVGSYALLCWSIWPRPSLFPATLPLAAACMGRYLFLALRRGQGEFPERQMGADPVFLALCAGWLGSVLFAAFKPGIGS